MNRIIGWLRTRKGQIAFGAITVTLVASATVGKEGDGVKKNELSPAEKYVILDKGTERPFSGKYVHHTSDGTYLCKQCNNPLFRSGAKFDSGSGWPSFDDTIDGAVKLVPDADGMRTEIVCARCGGHLGHVFYGEGMTSKNTRHCVNSLSLDFVPAREPLERAVFAGGCFWGVEYYLSQAKGVRSVRSGYIGGAVDNPTYRQVSSGKSGHAEAVEVNFNPRETDFRTLAKLFFEIHDPTEKNRQGPDIGSQYRSAVFPITEKQKDVVNELVSELKSLGYEVATTIEEATMFWPAETYHQDYYEKKGTLPYCHARVKRFVD